MNKLINELINTRTNTTRNVKSLQADETAKCRLYFDVNLNIPLEKTTNASKQKITKYPLSILNASKILLSN